MKDGITALMEKVKDPYTDSAIKLEILDLLQRGLNIINKKSKEDIYDWMEDLRKMVNDEE